MFISWDQIKDSFSFLWKIQDQYGMFEDWANIMACVAVMCKITLIPKAGPPLIVFVSYAKLEGYRQNPRDTSLLWYTAMF